MHLLLEKCFDWMPVKKAKSQGLWSTKNEHPTEKMRWVITPLPLKNISAFVADKCDPDLTVQLGYQGHQLEPWQCNSVDCICLTHTHTCACTDTHTHTLTGWIEGWWMGDAVAMALTRSWYKFRGYKRLCHSESACRCLLAACVGGSTQLVFCLSLCMWRWSETCTCVCAREVERQTGGKMIGVKWDRPTKPEWVREWKCIHDAWLRPCVNYDVFRACTLSLSSWLFVSPRQAWSTGFH